MDRREKLHYIAMAALIAGLYAALTLVFAPISFSAVQVRIAEALNILPMFTPAAVPGLFLGCLLGNLLGGAMLLDVIFGSIATLIGAYVGRLLKDRRWLVPIPSIVSNALIIPFILRYVYSIDLPILLLCLYIAIGEFLGSYVLGQALAQFLIRRKDLFRPRK
ncbi:MAG: QueT transporter family protein [Erysipelotrichaceae bacterium]|nr:QueT transporter family protein [Erysipelotrichaceae bacterium]